MTINPFSPILDTAVSNVIQVLSNSTVAPPSAGTIAFSNSQFSINENGTPITQVTLTRTGGSTGAVSATLNLSNGTATAGNDYIQTPILVTFADGETSKTVNLTQVSQGLSFNGIDSYIEVGDQADLKVSNAITIEAWINPSGGGTETMVGFLSIRKVNMKSLVFLTEPFAGRLLILILVGLGLVQAM